MLSDGVLQDCKPSSQKSAPSSNFSDTLDDLQHNQTDIAIRGGDRALDDLNLVARHLVTWPYMICAAPDYLNRHPPITHPSQLHAHRWLHFLPVRTTLQHGGESYFLDIADSIACTHLAAVCSLTESGFGFIFASGRRSSGKIAQGRLKTVLPEWTLPPVSLYLVTPYRVQSAKTEAAVRIFTESFAKEAEAERGKLARLPDFCVRTARFIAASATACKSGLPPISQAKARNTRG